MARTMNAENVEHGGGKKLTPVERQKIIRMVIQECRSLTAEAQSINAQRRELLNKHVKGDLGMKIADFNSVLRLSSLEDDDRDVYLATLRETFAALEIGQQLDFLNATGGIKATPTAGPVDADGFATGAQAQATEAEAYNLGEAAGRDGKGLDACPYTAAQKRLKTRFEEGWSDARAAQKVVPLNGKAKGAEKPKAGAQPAPQEAPAAPIAVAKKRGRPSKAELEARAAAAAASNMPLTEEQRQADAESVAEQNGAELVTTNAAGADPRQGVDVALPSSPSGDIALKAAASHKAHIESLPTEPAGEEEREPTSHRVDPDDEFL
jgi:ribosome modulation factor